MGAADYIVIPFSPTELAARISTALRRRLPPELVESSEPYVLGDLTTPWLLPALLWWPRSRPLSMPECRSRRNLSVLGPWPHVELSNADSMRTETVTLRFGE